MLPYSSHSNSIDDANWKLIQQAGRLGYLTVMSEADSHDWDRPALWRRSMELLATEVMPKFSQHASAPRT